MSNVEPLRRAFFDRTNAAIDKKQIPLRRKLDQDTFLDSNKRPRYADPVAVPPAKTQFRDTTNVTNFNEFKRKQKYGYSTKVALLSFSSRPILTTLVSSQKSDRYCLHIRDDNGSAAIPFSCAFSRGAKQGKSLLFSVGTQDGAIEILNVKPRLDWEGEPQRTVLQIHDSAIFGLQYRFDDEYMATASHDSTCRITCLSTEKCTAVLTGHTGAVRSVDWFSNHNSLLCTGGRDGSIFVWDIRCANAGSGALSPVCAVTGAHADPPTRRRKKTASIRSITSVVSILGTSQIISSSSFDAKLHHWDYRFNGSSLVDFGGSLDDPTLATCSRGRGVSALALGSNLTAGYLWSVAADSRIHRYTLPLGASSQYQPKALSHSRFKVKSFHVKLAVSPCGRWLASGSSNGGTYIWDVSDPLSATAVELISSTKEIGPLDWGNDMLATCCDDGIIRIWRPNVEVAFQCRANPEEESWNWFWYKDL